jgi:hypothetical protein
LHNSTSNTPSPCGLPKHPLSPERSTLKKLHAQACQERFSETEAFIAKAKARLIGQGCGESPERIEQGLRDALLRDGRRIVSVLYNDRTLFPDTAKPLPFETCYHGRCRNVETLFGRIRLSRNYYHHSKSGTGRCPLDDALGLECGCSPAVARLICRAASLGASFEHGADDLAAYAGLSFDPRDLGRMVAALAPGLVAS